MLNFSNVVVAIQGAAILRRVSFHIDSGQTVALVGRNGAGKTTILRAIMGLTNVVSGQISFEARDISRMPPHQRPGLGIGYAPDDRRLFSAFTVEENIRLPAEVARLSPERIAKRLHEIYELVPELIDLGPRPAGQISGGQGKIVALGRALMLGSRLILLDEPFQGLAPIIAARYGDALRTLKSARPHMSILITESNPSLLAALSERTLVIERGHLTESTESNISETAFAT
jgi:branched-chain amino acid transport system ATP-binding protein